MSSIISQDTYTYINTLSKEYKITSNNIKPGKNKNILRTHILELKKKISSVHNPTLSESLKSWLKTLPSSTLFSVFATHNPLICTFLIQMNLKIQSEGNFDFALVENAEKKVQEFELDKLFYMRKGNREDKGMKKKEFEGFLRFMDTEDYLDTLCLEQRPLRNLDKILEFFDLLSGNEAFKVPCLAYWDGYNRKWLHEYPAWHVPSKFFSLAHWACACLERSVWIKFFQMTHTDPRAPEETASYNLEYKILHSVENVLIWPEFMRSLDKLVKEELLGDHATISKIFQDVKTKFGNFNPAHFISKNQVTFHVSSSEGLKNFNNQSSIENLFQISRTNSEEILIEYLLCTPLARATSIYDLTLRIVSLKIKEMYTEKMAEELLKDSPTRTEKMKKLKKRRKKANKVKDIEPKIEIEENKEESVTQALVKKLMEGMYQFIETSEQKSDPVPEEINEAGFKIVNQKKKNRKGPQDFKPNHYNLKHKNSGRAAYTKPQTTVKQNQIRSEKILKFSWQTTPVTIQSSVNPIDFPPLSSMSSHNSSPLHIEIVQYVSSTLSLLSKKYQVLSVICIHINEIIEKLFAGRLFVYGSYATGLAVEGSDIDLAVDCKEEMSRDKVQKNCLELASVLRNIGFILECNAIITATVPLVKIEADLQPFAGVPLTASIDIIFVNHEKVGDSLIKANEYMKEIQRSLPQIHPLAITLKSFLYQHNLNSVYQGN